MPRIDVNGTELRYEVQGSGEPVVLVHAGLIADAFEPVRTDPILTERYQVISYHRRGYGGSRRTRRPLSLRQQAEDCRELMRRLGLERAHVVGHSLGGTIAVQLALEAPEAVHTLSLMEPIIPAALEEPEVARFFIEVLERAVAQYHAGDKAGAVDTWCQGAFGPGYRDELDHHLPGAFEQAVADADASFLLDLPALRQWRFTRDDAANLNLPVLSMFHDDPVWQGYRCTHELLLDWLPRVDESKIPNANHLLTLQNPRVVAEALESFFARHPISGIEAETSASW
ncbi:MAG TPA: alpha/beta hydrolase [Myxococcaceae bacterium]|nr:alpha/beta hydrolase [Myxococcaceae bacterium]